MGEDQTALVIAKVAAMLLGVIPAFALLWGIFSANPGSGSFMSFVLYALGRIGIVAALHAAFGVTGGFAFPKLAWRWGIWLYVPTLFLLISFLLITVSNMVVVGVDFKDTQGVVEALLLFGLFAGSLVAACLGGLCWSTGTRTFFFGVSLRTIVI